MTLVEFLRARLDEDERAAREVPGPEWERGVELDGKPGRLRDIKAELVTLPPADRDGVSAGAEVARTADRRVAAHIARWAPDQVLDEVAAKRTILDLVADSIERGGLLGDPVADFAQEVLEALARPYVDHPDFQEAWKL